MLNGPTPSTPFLRTPVGFPSDEFRAIAEFADCSEAERFRSRLLERGLLPGKVLVRAADATASQCVLVAKPEAALEASRILADLSEAANTYKLA